MNVRCAKCGIDLQINAVLDYHNDLDVDVTPCDTCLYESREEGIVEGKEEGYEEGKS